MIHSKDDPWIGLACCRAKFHVCTQEVDVLIRVVSSRRIPLTLVNLMIANNSASNLGVVRLCRIDKSMTLPGVVTTNLYCSMLPAKLAENSSPFEPVDMLLP